MNVWIPLKCPRKIQDVLFNSFNKISLTVRESRTCKAHKYFFVWLNVLFYREGKSTELKKKIKRERETEKETR